MQRFLKNKLFDVQEVGAYYILGYRRYLKNKKDKYLTEIIGNILEVAKEKNGIIPENEVNMELLKKIKFFWAFNSSDLVSYAICIFHSLRDKEKVTDEEIIEKFTEELYAHHPREEFNTAVFIWKNTP